MVAALTYASIVIRGLISIPSLLKTGLLPGIATLISLLVGIGIIKVLSSFPREEGSNKPWGYELSSSVSSCILFSDYRSRKD